MPTALITRKGQVTIPKEIRDLVGWKRGDRLTFVARGGDVVVKRQEGTILDLKGSVPPRERPEDFDDIRRQVQQKRAARSAQ